MNIKENQSIPELKKEINIKEQFTIIKKRIWVLLTITLITTSIGIIKSVFFTTPIYQSSTRVIISADAEMMKTLIVLIKDTAVLEKVVSELEIDKPPEMLAQQISVSSIDGSQVVNISVLDSDPEKAAEIANTTAKVYKNELPNIIGFKQVKLLKSAKANPYPINSDKSRTIIIFIIIGITLGIGMIYFLYMLDDSIGSNEDIEKILGFPVLGTVPKMNKRNIRQINNKINDLEI
ncbi:capsular polysaccharide biosynthesis protein [Bacillus niacini]|uniref:Capsular polysaccharide biosynthesis protein n=1 Tax=Neobacillus niacini TaxID=86668 RepID=A0A852T7M4_9BACI|nr:Wzz/FepE/Etk N-terminal domain-containing protein [Neobacillus niacini]NYE03845.1 capsular polysaccharide biosynthesis protein [Neobacillus niacini]